MRVEEAVEHVDAIALALETQDYRLLLPWTVTV
jgi:hypothetical protein